MGRIELKHYPASRLPAELRQGIAEGAFVNITVEADTAAAPSREQFLKALRRDVPAGKGVSVEDAVRRIRDLRDEWDD
jgi:hypothetical protein